MTSRTCSRPYAVALAVGSAAVLAAGCGTQVPSSGQPTTVSTNQARASAVTTTAGPTTQAHASSQPAASPAPNAASAPAPADQRGDPARCRTNELNVSLGRVGGAAGSVGLTLVFTNTGGRTCTLVGFPGVSYVDAPGGSQVGAAATREGAASGPVSLAPGAQAHALVQAVQAHNYPADICGYTPVSGLRVFPPNDFDSRYVPYQWTGCSKTGPDVHQLSVQAVSPGNGG